MFLLHSKRGCPHCARARDLLRSFGFTYKLRFPNKEGLVRDTGSDTYPQIYELGTGTRIGGADDLEAFLGVRLVPGTSRKPSCTQCGKAAASGARSDRAKVPAVGLRKLGRHGKVLRA